MKCPLCAKEITQGIDVPISPLVDSVAVSFLICSNCNVSIPHGVVDIRPVSYQAAIDELAKHQPLVIGKMGLGDLTTDDQGENQRLARVLVNSFLREVAAVWSRSGQWPRNSQGNIGPTVGTIHLTSQGRPPDPPTIDLIPGPEAA